MEIQKTQKVKASQKILSFIRNEKEKNKESYIIHRSDRGMKEIPVKPLSEFAKKMEKTRLCDGVLDEDEIEDLDKVYEQLKKFIENKHGTSFKPSLEEVKRFMDAYLAEKNKKINKNAFNSYLNCKKMREEYMKSKIEKRQENKRIRELAMHGIIVKEIKPDVELNERDKRLFEYFQKPYMKRPNSVNVNLRISEYNKNKADINKECQIIQKECNEMIKDQLSNGNKSYIYGQQITNESFIMKTPTANRAQTAQSMKYARIFSSSASRRTQNDDQKFAKSCNTYCDQNDDDKYEQNIKNDTKTDKKRKLERSLDLSPYNMAEKSQIDKRKQSNLSEQFYSTNKNADWQNGFAKNDNLDSSYGKNRKIFQTATTFYTPNQYTKKESQEESYYEPQNIFLTSQTAQKTNYKQFQNNKHSYTNHDNDNSQQCLEDKFVRKTIISMVTGKPVRPYLQLSSLAEKIEMRGKEKKQRERTKILDDNKLKTFEEFRNYNFQIDQKNIPVTHSNYLQSSNANQNNTLANNSNLTGINSQSALSQADQNIRNQAILNQRSDRKSILINTNNISKITTARQSISLTQDNKKSQFNTSHDNSFQSPTNKFQDIQNRTKNLSISFKSQTGSSQSQTPRNLSKSNKKRSISTFEKAKYSINNEIKEQIKLEDSENIFSQSFTKDFVNESFLKTPKQSTERKNYAFSVNNRYGEFQKLVERINKLRGHENFKPNHWEEMRLIENEIPKCKKEDEKIELRKQILLLGRKQFQALKDKEDEEEEIKAQKFEKLIQKTQYYENKLISQFEDIKKTKQRKNEEFKFLIETLNRDRPMTREIRMRNYNLVNPLYPPSNRDLSREKKEKDGEQRINLSILQMRENAEDERKKVLESNEKQVEWYQQCVNKLALLSSNEEDMTICHLVMDYIKQILEDGTSFELDHIEHVISFIEKNKRLQYNSNSLYSIELAVQLFQIHITDLSSCHKLQEAYQKKLNQREKSYKTDISSTVHSSAMKLDQ